MTRTPFVPITRIVGFATWCMTGCVGISATVLKDRQFLKRYQALLLEENPEARER